MNLISLSSFFILVAFLLIYYITPKRFRWIILLMGNAIFWLIFSSPLLGLYLLVGAMSVYFAAIIIQKLKDRLMNYTNLSANEQNSLRRRQKIALGIALFINLGLLFTFKYLNVFLNYSEYLLRMLGLSLDLKTVKFLAPLGISFYTLQLISYLLDVYWDVAQAQKNPFKYLLYATFFPQMVSGPINRYNDLSPQLYATIDFSYDSVCFGLQRILWGVFKKLVIAERLGLIVNTVFTDYTSYSGAYIWLVIIFAMFHLYTDFSGSMDIFLGIAETLGIRMVENFNQPFIARSTQEFWQRWHITLGLWLKDYVMFPLQRSRGIAYIEKFCKKLFGKKAGRKIPMYVSMLVVWLSLGLWHGGGLNYIMQGFWFWCVIVLGQISAPWLLRLAKLLKINLECFGWKVFQVIRTTVIFAIGGVLLFSAHGGTAAFKMLQSALSISNLYVFFDITHIAELAGWEALDIVVLWCGFLVLCTSAIIKLNGINIRTFIAKQNLLFRWLCYLALVFVIILFGKYGSDYNAADFIYAGF